MSWIKKQIKKEDTEALYRKAYKKYPSLKSIQTKEAVLEIFTQLENIKWQRGYSLSFILLTIITILVAVYFNVFPQPYKPIIHLSTNYLDNEVYISEQTEERVDFLLYITNQGTGACVDMRLNYSDFYYPYLRPQKTFRQYTDIKDEVKDDFNSSAFLSSDNVWRMGILEENEAIVVDFVRKNKDFIPNKFSITVSCNNGEEKTITIKRLNKI
jgi:hypothetical protein